MKQVLVIDESPVFRDFLKNKLTQEKITAEVSTNRRDGFPKLVAMLPDLLILDVTFPFNELIEFLNKKRNNLNTCRIPTILLGPVIADRSQIAQLSMFYVFKYFSKPIKMDIFFETIAKILRTSFNIDTTSCILETHINNNIIFIEIARGINHEKASMLKYKLAELIEENSINAPKVILMMSDLTLSFVDGTNLEFLLDNIIADGRIKPKNIKVLSLDNFTKELIAGHEEYSEIEVSEDLSSIMNELIKPSGEDDVPELLAKKVLTYDGKSKEGTIQMRFNSDVEPVEKDAAPKETNYICTVAIVDDDIITRSILQKNFQVMNAKVEVFDSGSAFLSAIGKINFDIAILDIFMPGISGYDIIANLKAKGCSTKIVVYSSVNKKENVIQALTLGAKSYLVKPLKPEFVVKKALELLNEN